MRLLRTPAAAKGAGALAAAIAALLTHSTATPGEMLGARRVYDAGDRSTYLR